METVGATTADGGIPTTAAHEGIVDEAAILVAVVVAREAEEAGSLAAEEAE